MKKRKKTIIEENKTSMSKKIGKYAVIVVLYIALVSTLAFIMSTISLIVNADSINDTPDYQYMKTSYYNWDSITWRDTNGNNYVSGSNDTFSTEETWSDYFAINDINVGNTRIFNDVLTVPSFVDFNSNRYGFGNEFANMTYGDDFYVFQGMQFGKATVNGVSHNRFIPLTSLISGLSGVYYDFYDNFWYGDYRYIITDINLSYLENFNIDIYNWFIENTSIVNSLNGDIIKRNIVYNSDLSTIDTFVYDSTIISDLKFESIVFEKDNFFLRVGDLNKVGSPQISATVLNGGYDISYDIVGWIKRQDGSTQNITVNVDKREGVLGYQYLLPSRQELFGNVETITNDDMMYIESYRVLVEFPNNYVNNLSYRYGVDSLELNNINYGGALSNWVNSSIGINMGDILLDNVNAFLQFEILPNFTLFNLFVLIVAIPLLIWILKLILGG